MIETQDLLTHAIAARLTSLGDGLRVYAAPVAQGLAHPCVLIEAGMRQKKLYPCGRYWEEFPFTVRYLLSRTGMQVADEMVCKFVHALELLELTDGSSMRALDCTWEMIEEELRLSVRYGAFFLVDADWSVMQELRLQNGLDA